MKKLLIFLPLALLTAEPVYAQDPGDKFCERIAKFSEIAMNGRQGGLTLTELREIINTRLNVEKSEHRLLLMIANDAYTTPQYSTETNKRRAVTDFRAKWEKGCYEILDERRSEMEAEPEEVYLGDT